MLFPSLSRLSNRALRERLRDAHARHRGLTAEILHVLAEVDRRRLWAEAGYSSLYTFCVGELRLAEDAAFRHMRAARLARRYPVIPEMVADGRLHLSGLMLLHPHIQPSNAAELLQAAVHKSKREIRALLAERFPQADVATQVTPIAAPAGFRQLAPEPVGISGGGNAELAPAPVGSPGRASAELAPAPVESPAGTSAELAPEPVAAQAAPPVPPPFPNVAPLAPERYAVQFTMSQQMHDKLQHAKELLSHAMPGAELPAVLERALDVLIEKLEKRRFAKTERPRTPDAVRPPATPRGIPAHVRRHVWQRDAGACTWVGDGRRCGSRIGVEFHHEDPVGKGGAPPKVGTVRLLCRAHNRLQAERDYGEGYVHEIIERSRGATETRRERGTVPPLPAGVARTTPPAPA